MSEPEPTAGAVQWHSLLPDDEADGVGAGAIQVAWEVQYAADLLWTSVRFRVRTTEQDICIRRAVFSVWIGADIDEPSRIAAAVSIDYLPGMLLQEYQEMLTLPHLQLNSSSRGHALLSIEGSQGEIATIWTGRNEFEWKEI